MLVLTAVSLVCGFDNSAVNTWVSSPTRSRLAPWKGTCLILRLNSSQLALKAGRASFTLATSTGDSSLEEQSGPSKSITVAGQKLDEEVARIFPTGKLALLKIEAEGFEPEVLAGWGTETLKRGPNWSR
jgi:hypothetical protein